MYNGEIKPVMRPVKNVLFIGAHPDDIELGTGGTLIRHIHERDNVFVIIATDGEKGNGHVKEGSRLARKMKKAVDGNSSKRYRLTEARKAFMHVNVPEKNMFLLHLDDTNIDPKKLFSVIEKVCNENNIHRIYTHTSKDYHQDHVAVFNESIRAARSVPDILTYETNSSSLSTFSPTHFIDITEFIEKKLQLLKFHKTQLDKQYLHAESILANAKFRGNQTRQFRYAEAFEPVRTISWNGDL